MVRPPSRGLYPFLSLFVGWGVCFPAGLVSLLCPLVPLLVALCCRPSRGLSSFVSPCAPSGFPLLDGASAFSRVLFPCGSHCTPSSCLSLLDGVSAFRKFLSPLVSRCTPSRCPLLDGVSAFPRLSRLISHVALSWMVCPSSRECCLPFGCAMRIVRESQCILKFFVWV